MKSLFFGAVAFIITAYSCVLNPHGERNVFILFFAVINSVLFPYAKITVEKIALKYTDKEFWHKGFFKDDVGKNGLVAIFWIFCYIFSLPLSILWFFIKEKNKYAYNTKKTGSGSYVWVMNG